MTKLPFRLKGVQDPIRWETGQPLGAKSSWAMFTIAHHVIVAIAAQRAEEPLARVNYMILGDDIVIQGSRLAREYKRLMSDLGVEISETKTHASRDTYEFAKM